MAEGLPISGPLSTVICLRKTNRRLLNHVETDRNRGSVRMIEKLRSRWMCRPKDWPRFSGEYILLLSAASVPGGDGEFLFIKERASESKRNAEQVT